MLSVLQEETGMSIAQRAKARRLALNLTQAGVAARAGVSFGSLKRFERTGEISLSSLLRIARVLDALAEFQAIFPKKEPVSLDDVLQAARPRRRASIR
jgi:transcriptional regulator with XRE-family HTH domain